MNGERYCLCTEASNYTIKYTISMIFSFLDNNRWFAGDIVIFEMEQVPLSRENKDLIRELYPQVLFKKANNKTVQRYVNLFNKKSKYPRELLIRHMVLEAFRLSTYNKVLYSSSTNVFFGNVSEIFSGSFDIKTTYNTREFPYVAKLKNLSKDEQLNTSLMVISEHLLNELVYQSLVDLVLSNKTAYDGLQKRAITDYVYRNKYEVGFLNTNYLASFSCFSDPNFKKYKRHQKSIKAIEYNIFFNDRPNTRYKKIERLWVMNYAKYQKVANNDQYYDEFQETLNVNNLQELSAEEEKEKRSPKTYLHRRIRYIDNNITHNEGIAIIKDAIDEGKPFAFTRFGDGDMNLIRSKYDKKWVQTAFRKQGLTDGTFAKRHRDLKRVIINGMKCSDMIGVMSRTIINQFNFNPASWAISVGDLKKYGISMENKLVTDHQLPHSKKFGYIPSFKQLIDGKPIHIISHHVDYLKENNLSDLLGCDITYTKSPAYFYSNREQIIETMPNIQEQIVLFACSGGGKDIGVMLKENYGKTAIDMGSVIDAWAGVISRIRFNPGKAYNYLVVGEPRYKVAYSLQSPGAKVPREK